MKTIHITIDAELPQRVDVRLGFQSSPPCLSARPRRRLRQLR
jgi:hypothetical protein